MLWRLILTILKFCGLITLTGGYGMALLLFPCMKFLFSNMNFHLIKWIYVAFLHCIFIVIVHIVIWNFTETHSISCQHPLMSIRSIHNSNVLTCPLFTTNTVFISSITYYILSWHSRIVMFQIYLFKYLLHWHFC